MNSQPVVTSPIDQVISATTDDYARAQRDAKVALQNIVRHAQREIANIDAAPREYLQPTDFLAQYAATYAEKLATMNALSGALAGLMWMKEQA